MDPRSLNAEEKAHTEPASIPVEKQEPAKPRGLLSRIRYYEEVLDRKLGIESHSLDRVLPENRKPPNSLAMALMWASATINISCFSTGFLGKKFGLSLGQTIAITICATALGAAVTGWCATMGPGTGLRQVAISRYSLGFYPSSIIAALNVIEQLGWASVNCITGGLALSAVSDGRVSIAVGVVIVACVSFLFSFVGLRGVLIHRPHQVRKCSDLDRCGVWLQRILELHCLGLLRSLPCQHPKDQDLLIHHSGHHDSNLYRNASWCLHQLGFGYES